MAILEVLLRHACKALLGRTLVRQENSLFTRLVTKIVISLRGSGFGDCSVPSSWLKPRQTFVIEIPSAAGAGRVATSALLSNAEVSVGKVGSDSKPLRVNGLRAASPLSSAGTRKT